MCATCQCQCKRTRSMFHHFTSYIHVYTHTHIRKSYYLKSTNDIVTSSPYAHVFLAANALVNFKFSLRVSASARKNKEINLRRENNNLSFSRSPRSNSIRAGRRGLRCRFAENHRSFTKETLAPSALSRRIYVTKPTVRFLSSLSLIGSHWWKFRTLGALSFLIIIPRHAAPLLLRREEIRTRMRASKDRARAKARGREGERWFTKHGG